MRSRFKRRWRTAARIWTFRCLDLLCAPLTTLAALLLYHLRKLEIERPPLRENFPLAQKIMRRIGILPIIDHYYEPLFSTKHLRRSLRQPRTLPGIDFNDVGQLELLNSFCYSDELIEFPRTKRAGVIEYCYSEGAFLCGDAEYLYNMIRHFKPGTIIEIGSGHSTLMAINATSRNKAESPDYRCDHICIEPYECPWLEEKGIRVIRQKVETLDLSLFKKLKANDILFIDSSHIIRPQGDVLFEYLEILPSLNKGVICHMHDIFTPADYLDEWFGEKLWNEQYLLEAFLSLNKEFRIIGATNYLWHEHRDAFLAKCPVFAEQEAREPASFWIQRV